MNFNNANDAFKVLYEKIHRKGKTIGNTMALFNIGFNIVKPLDNVIKTDWRNWNKDYAEYEWQWYLSGNPSGNEIAKRAKIWNNCMDELGNVNSNYGYHWKQGNQIEYVVKELSNDPNSRRASISIYDAKNRHNFDKDTPCTYAINFSIYKDKLNMSVLMRSNDLWYGFCNDQYCFSKLQEKIANTLNKEVGYYYHFAQNLHLYNNFLNKQQ